MRLVLITGMSGSGKSVALRLLEDIGYIASTTCRRGSWRGCLPGVPTGRLRDLAVALGRGGVGFYPASDFVHLDTGRSRRW